MPLSMAHVVNIDLGLKNDLVLFPSFCWDFNSVLDLKFWRIRKHDWAFKNVVKFYPNRNLFQLKQCLKCSQTNIPRGLLHIADYASKSILSTHF